jgi:uncharacterized protein
LKGAGTRDFFASAYGQSGEKFEGFKFGDANIQFDDTLLLIQPEAAVAYEAANPRVAPPAPAAPGLIPAGTSTSAASPATSSHQAVPSQTAAKTAPKAKSYHGSVEVSPVVAKMRLVQIAEEIIAILAADPNADIKISVEIDASFPHGAQDQTKRAVSENGKTLGFKTSEWE